MIFICIPITHCASQQTQKGCFLADSEVKLKASISTTQARCEGSDLKADRAGAIPALSLTDRLLSFDSHQDCWPASKEASSCQLWWKPHQTLGRVTVVLLATGTRHPLTHSCALGSRCSVLTSKTWKIISKTEFFCHWQNWGECGDKQSRQSCLKRQCGLQAIQS